jgi:O-antigen/teichoic acid export membrane protein/glycosyltransferase involved in cell wall biosynthesis
MSELRPLVSVVLPVKEPSPEFLVAAVGSVLAQTLKDIELLLIEAVCPDAASVSSILVAESKDPRLRILRASGCNLVEQLNQGLQSSRAKYIARMDGDDLCLPHRLDVQRQFLDARPEVDVVGSHIAIIDSRGRSVGIRQYPTSHDGIAAAMQRYNPLAHPAVMFRRQSVIDAGGYRYPERAAQDYELWARMASAGCRFANLDEVLLQYRVHQGAIKARRVRDTLESTIRTKREYFGSSMPLRARCRILFERGALLLPPALVVRAYTWLAFRGADIDSSRRQRRDSVLLVLSTGISAALSMAYMTLVARRLGPAEAADFYAALFLVFALLTILGPAGGVVSHVAAVCHARGDADRSEGVARWIARRLVVLSALLAVPIWLSMDGVVAALRLKSPWTLASVYLITGSFIWLTLERSLLRGRQRFGAYSASVLAEPLLRLGMGVVVLGVATNASLALLPYSVSAVAAVAMLRRRTGAASARSLDGGAIRSSEILRYAAPMAVACLADAGHQNVDILIVKMFCSAREAGVYSAVASVTRMLGVLVTPFVAQLLPVMTGLHERNLTVNRSLLRNCGAFVGLGSVLLLAFAVWSETIVRSLFGEAFIEGAPLLLPLGASVLLGHIALLIAQAFLATRRVALLGIYLGGAGLEVLVLGLWHRTLAEIVTLVLAVKLASLVALVIGWLHGSKGARCG